MTTAGVRASLVRRKDGKHPWSAPRIGRVIFDVTLDSHGVHAMDLADDFFHRHLMALNLFAHTGCSFSVHAKARQGHDGPETQLVNW
jgi:hypothetical protein